MNQWIYAAALLAVAASAVPLSGQKTFGHSVKNGALPANKEVTSFEHTCETAPCVITQIHVPSIYPPHGEAWDWTHGILRFYIDGEASASVECSLAEIAGESVRFAQSESHSSTTAPDDGSPYGLALFGKTAKSGGVYSTVRIPFGKSVKVTIQSSTASKGQSIYWMIIRGLEAHAVAVGDLVLPKEARLKLYRFPVTTVKDKQFITLANISAGTAGALLQTNFAASGPSFGYLEACMRFFPDGATEPVFLSSGAEDYFLSASYFDEGMFKTPNSGLTFFDHRGTLGVYKTHDRK
jgi:hypothetical protein